MSRPSLRLPVNSFRSLRVYFACLLVLVPASRVPLRASDPIETMASQLSDAAAELERGDYPAAGNAVRGILAEGSAPDPIRGHALTLLGKVLFFNSRVGFYADRPREGQRAREARLEEERRGREEGMRLSEEALRDAVRLDGPHRADARHYLAQVLLARGRRPEAREELAAYFEEVGEASPDPRAVHLRRCLGEAPGPPIVDGEQAVERTQEKSAAPEAIRQVDELVEAPKKLSGSQPGYTEAAREARLQGVVIVQVIIEKNGDVRCGKPLIGLPLGLTEATLDSLSEWKYEPARFKGHPVTVYYNLTVNFRLK